LIIETGFEGQGCADAMPGTAKKQAASTAATNLIGVSSEPVEVVSFGDDIRR
jgi:hypothetical protein